ncbi:glycosyltransferase [Halomarina pelagica]|uniref:glycosyltransferase n=1 Tax=Halomarina pelagica TaxID=2961599 RepID=UPI0020C22881|nr:glycosyltransferase [Halomarina sp. BND7]
MASASVIVPAYRPDSRRLAGYVRKLDARLDLAEIRIELDVPRRGTLDRLADLPVTSNAVAERRGKGAAITAGFDALDAEVLAFVDADGSTPVDEIAAILDPVTTGSADLAVGSRRHPDAVVESHQTHARRHLGDAFAWLARRVLDVPLYDYQCGAKAITADAWDAVREHVREPGFAWDIELVTLVGALGRHVEEVPIRWRDHPKSTVAPVGTSLSMARGLFAARRRARRLRDDRVADALAGDATTRADPHR